MRGADAAGRGRLRAFLSYASEDRAAVLALRRRLQEAGVSTWVDVVELVAGQDWRLEIERGLRNCDVFLACLSPVSLAKEGYVQKELRMALDRQDEMPPGAIFLIPVLLAPCEPEGRLALLHQARLWDPDGFQALLGGLARKAEANGIRLPPPGAPSGPIAAPATRSPGVLLELTVPEKRILLMLLERSTPAYTSSITYAARVTPEMARKYVDRLMHRDPALVSVRTVKARGPLRLLEYALTAEGRRVAAALQAI